MKKGCRNSHASFEMGEKLSLLLFPLEFVTVREKKKRKAAQFCQFKIYDFEKWSIKNSQTFRRLTLRCAMMTLTAENSLKFQFSASLFPSLALILIMLMHVRRLLTVSSQMSPWNFSKEINVDVVSACECIFYRSHILVCNCNVNGSGEENSMREISTCSADSCSFPSVYRAHHQMHPCAIFE